jgi:1-acyl-sn-glycerol-3-phosphate acyltransferase
MPPMLKRHLRGFERISVPLLEATNRRPWLRRILHFASGWLNAAWIYAATAKRWQISGLESLQTLDAPGGIILVSNHRSFFDMFTISTILKFRTGLLTRVAYPVRSSFFYTTPLGVLINYAIAGASMWPPVFRDDRRRTLNTVGMQQLAHTLGKGAVVGMHPEGTRSHHPSPYEFLPRKPGLGQLLAVCAPDVLVLPVFIHGLSSDLVLEIRRGRDLPSLPIKVYFGAPLRVADLQEQAQTDPQATTELVFAQVRRLAEIDRASERTVRNDNQALPT